VVWFLAYCVFCVSFFLIGSSGLGLSWLWSTVFSLFSSGAFLVGSRGIILSRLCPRRVKAVVASGRTSKDVLPIMEHAFGEIPYNDSAYIMLLVILSFLPLAMLGFQLLGLLMESLFWRVVLTPVLWLFFLSIEMQMATRLMARRTMLQKVEQTVKEGYGSQIWDTWRKLWLKRMDEASRQAMTPKRQTRPSRHLSRVRKAVVRGQLNEVGRLLGTEHGEDLNALMLVAISNGHHEVAELLLRHGAVAEPYLLSYAAREGHPKIVELLLKRGIDVDTREDHFGGGGQTPLIQAATHDNQPLSKGHVEVARLLLKHGADVHAKAPVGLTALELVHKYGVGRSHGSTDESGHTPEGRQILQNERALIQLLNDWGAEP